MAMAPSSIVKGILWASSEWPFLLTMELSLRMAEPGAVEYLDYGQMSVIELYEAAVA